MARALQQPFAEESAGISCQPLDRPKLRPLSTSRFEYQGQSYVLIQDPSARSRTRCWFRWTLFMQVCRHFEGQLSLDGNSRPRSCVRPVRSCRRQVLEQLVDRARLGDGTGWTDLRVVSRVVPISREPPARRWRADPTRPARKACVSSLSRYFGAAGGAGRPALVRPSRSRGPWSNSGRSHPAHRLQPGRSGLYVVVQGTGRSTQAIDTFVILGVAHQYCRRRFALTFKDFSTPLGLGPDRSRSMSIRSPLAAAGSSSMTSWYTGPSIPSSSRSCSCNTCWARSGTSRSCRSWSGRFTT